VLVDVSRRDMSATLFRQKISLPILIAPTAFHKLAHPDGDLATVRAAGAEGTIMVLSSLSTTLVEDVVAAATGRFGFNSTSRKIASSRVTWWRGWRRPAVAH